MCYHIVEDFMAIKEIICCCGMGMGTSLLAKMNIEKALGNIGVNGVNVEHSTLTEAKGSKFDLLVISKDLEDAAKNLSNVLVLSNIMDIKEAETKLKAAFGI
jgi:PTS system ascorbate-specific IIB component